MATNVINIPEKKKFESSLLFARLVSALA